MRKVSEEKPAPLSADLAAVKITKPRIKPIRLIGFALALPLVGGYILPRALRRDVLKTAPIDSRAVGLATRYNRILYRHDRLPEGFVVERDARRFFALLREVCVVTKDIAPYAIAVGNPCRTIKFRFSEDIVNHLLLSKWWARNDNELMKLSRFFVDPIKFIDSLES